MACSPAMRATVKSTASHTLRLRPQETLFIMESSSTIMAGFGACKCSNHVAIDTTDCLCVSVVLAGPWAHPTAAMLSMRMLRLRRRFRHRAAGNTGVVQVGPLWLSASRVPQDGDRCRHRQPTWLLESRNHKGRQWYQWRLRMLPDRKESCKQFDQSPAQVSAYA